MKNFLVVLAGLCLLNGCLHTQPTYPGASTGSIDPAKYVDSDCPDLSGVYEYKGVLLKGDRTARQISAIAPFNNVFPISHATEWQSVFRKYRIEGPRNDLILPDSVAVTNVHERSILIQLDYNDGPIGSYHSEFLDKSQFVCAGNSLAWGGVDNIRGQSEWGKNTGNQSFSIYKDADGNLIYERKHQVHMNMLFGIPAGTAEYFAVYQFRKITPPN